MHFLHHVLSFTGADGHAGFSGGKCPAAATAESRGLPHKDLVSMFKYSMFYQIVKQELSDQRTALSHLLAKKEERKGRGKKVHKEAPGTEVKKEEEKGEEVKAHEQDDEEEGDAAEPQTKMQRTMAEYVCNGVSKHSFNTEMPEL